MVETTMFYKDLDASVKELIIAANQVRQFAYAPFSEIKVGAAFRSKCGRIFAGCNVEIDELSPVSCAERAAIRRATNAGVMEFTAAAVVSFYDDIFISPCDACKQLIKESSTGDIPLFLVKAIEQDVGSLQGYSHNAWENLPNDEVFCSSINNL